MFVCVSALAVTSEAYFSVLSRIGESALHTMSSHSLGMCEHAFVHSWLVQSHEWKHKEGISVPAVQDVSVLPLICSWPLIKQIKQCSSVSCRPKFTLRRHFITPFTITKTQCMRGVYVCVISTLFDV